MAINFPSSPSTDDVYLYNGVKYIYDGTKWISGGQTFQDANYAQVSGDTFTGNVEIGTGIDLNTDGTASFGGNVVIDSSGNLGVGTSTVYGRIHAASAENTATFVAEGEVDNPGYPAYGFAGQNLSNGTRGTGMYLPADSTLAFSTTAEERMRIDGSGNVGIGVTSAQGRLEVKEDGTGSQIQVWRSNMGTNNRTVVFHSPDTDSATEPFYWNTGNSFAWKIDAEERMRIDSTGNVGIGVTNPTQKLVVEGNIVSRTDNNSNGAQLDFGGALELWRADSIPYIDFKTSANEDYDCRIQQEDNGLRFDTGGNGSSFERMRIDSAGRLLVGTSTALDTKYFTSTFAPYLQHAAVDGTAGFYRFKADADGSTLILNKSRNASVGSHTVVSNEDTLGLIGFAGSDGTEFRTAAVIRGQVDGTPGTGDMPGRLVFYTSPDGSSTAQERMRISSAGNVLIHQTSTAVPGAGSTAVGASFENGGTDGTSLFVSRANNVPAWFNRNTDGNLVNIMRSGTEVGSISVTATATTYNTSSDYRLKENVANIADGITRVKQLKPSRFNFIADPDKTVDGFLAHEAQAVVPEAVTGVKDEVDDDGNAVMQSIDQSKLVPLLTAALQEAIAEIETLKARLDDAGL